MHDRIGFSVGRSARRNDPRCSAASSGRFVANIPVSLVGGLLPPPLLALMPVYFWCLVRPDLMPPLGRLRHRACWRTCCRAGRRASGRWPSWSLMRWSIASAIPSPGSAGIGAIWASPPPCSLVAAPSPSSSRPVTGTSRRSGPVIAATRGHHSVLHSRASGFVNLTASPAGRSIAGAISDAAVR